ncbi:MAG TPA: hypothetical protein VF308_12825 [Caldimonas sp.]
MRDTSCKTRGSGCEVPRIDHAHPHPLGTRHAQLRLGQSPALDQDAPERPIRARALLDLERALQGLAVDPPATQQRLAQLLCTLQRRSRSFQQGPERFGSVGTCGSQAPGRGRVGDERTVADRSMNAVTRVDEPVLLHASRQEHAQPGPARARDDRDTFAAEHFRVAEFEPKGPGVRFRRGTDRPAGQLERAQQLAPQAHRRGAAAALAHRDFDQRVGVAKGQQDTAHEAVVVQQRFNRPVKRWRNGRDRGRRGLLAEARSAWFKEQLDRAYAEAYIPL